MRLYYVMSMLPYVISTCNKMALCTDRERWSWRFYRAENLRKFHSELQWTATVANIHTRTRPLLHYIATWIPMYLFSGRRLVYRTRQWRLHAQAIPNNAPLCRATRLVTLGGSNESLRKETRPSQLTDVCDIVRSLVEYCSLINDDFPNAWRK